MPAKGTVEIKLHLNQGRWHWMDTKRIQYSTYKDEIDVAGIAEYWRDQTEQDAREQGQDVTVSVMSATLAA
jgi:hypothetical protein